MKKIRARIYRNWDVKSEMWELAKQSKQYTKNK